MAGQLDRCPYLGLNYDRALYTQYPNDDHRCFAQGTPAPVSSPRQRAVCLGPAHRSCWRLPERERSVHTIRPPRPVPAGFALPTLNRGTRLALAGGALVIVLILAIAQSVVSWNSSSSSATSPGVVGTVQPGGTDLSAGATGSRQPSTTPNASAEGSQSGPLLGTPHVDATPSPTAVPPTRTPVPAPASQTVHVVASGETLLVIAARYNVTVESITRANGITVTGQLSIGQKLIIPPATNR